MKRIPVKKACIELADIKGEDIQLWLFKVPETMNVAALNGASMKIGGTVAIGGSEFQVSEGASLESDALVNIWPDTNKGQMRLGKPFSKLVHVAEAPKTSATAANQIVQNLASFLKFGTTRNPIAAQNYDQFDTPVLKVRYAPAGAQVPVVAEETKTSIAASVASTSTKSTISTKASKEDKSSKKSKEDKHKSKDSKHKSKH